MGNGLGKPGKKGMNLNLVNSGQIISPDYALTSPSLSRFYRSKQSMLEKSLGPEAQKRGTGIFNIFTARPHLVRGIITSTLPETNSLHLKIDCWKDHPFLLGYSPFSGPN